MADDDRPRRTARDFHPEVLRLFDRYVHGGIDRRGFRYPGTQHGFHNDTTPRHDEAAARLEQPHCALPRQVGR